MEKIYTASLSFLLPLKAEEIYVSLVREAISLVGGDAGSVYIRQKRGIKKVYASESILYAIKNRKKGYTQKVFETGKPFVSSATVAHKIHPQFKALGFSSFMLIPIACGAESMGVLALHGKKQNQFSEEDIKILTLFCSLAFLTIRKVQLYQGMQKAIETRDLFISMASHELKTPLTSLMLYSELLKKSINKNSQEGKWMETISQDISRMNNLVQELLQIDLMKKGNLTYTIKTCDIEEIIKSSLLDFKALYPFHTVYYKKKLHDTKPVVKGDPAKLRQVINNLLHNAAKFSPINSPITISLYNYEGKIQLDIEDKGKGIDPEDLPNIFEKFYRGKTSQQEGMGLGLYIIKTIIENHHGTIAIDSELQKGTKVSIQLPKQV